MKSLEQINADLQAQVNQLVAKGMANPMLADLTNEAELGELHGRRLIADKFVELYEIVKLLDTYLQMPSLDGRMQRQEVRKTLQTMIDKL